MGKVRKSKGGKAFGAKTPAVERIKKQNPFDLIFKKTKSQTVVGVKNGKPPKFSSKRRAFDVRKSTIGVEYANDGKKNTIVDKRLAERDSELTAAEKAEKRFILQRKQLFSSNKRARFNLADDDKKNQDEADDDDLFPKTHPNGGKFSLRRKVDKDVDGGELDSNLVALANFGGGKFEEQKRAENLFPASGGTKRSDLLANLISASKQTKALRQMERDAQADTTDRLNALFARLKSDGVLDDIVGGGGKPALATTPHPSASLASEAPSATAAGGGGGGVNGGDDEAAKKNGIIEENNTVGGAPGNNSYDNLYRELQFDSGGQRAVATATKVFADLGKPEDFDALVAQFEQLAAVCTAENLEKLAPIVDKIYSHAKARPLICAERLLALLDATRTRRLAAAKSDAANFGGVDFRSLAFVRAVGRLFPTADRFHPVATPTLVFAAEVLARSRVRSATHATQLILFCNVLADWISTSKRYLPEVVAFLRGALLLCVENEEAEKFPSISFPITSPFRRMLLVDRKTKTKLEPISITQLFAEPENSECTDASTSSPSREDARRELRQKLQAIGALLATIRRYAELYSAHTVSFYAIFRPFLVLLKRLPCANFPKELADAAADVIAFIGGKLDSAPPLTLLKLPTRSVQRSLEMLEPRFDAHFDPETARFGGGASRKARKTEQAMRQRLRKETRGAMKELRTDAKFISRLQSERSQKISHERREKTKKILAGLQTQESEYKKRHLKKY